MQYTKALLTANKLIRQLGPDCIRIESCGSVRRMKPEVHDIELICIPRSLAPRPEFGQKTVFKTLLDKTLHELVQGGVLRPVMGGDRMKKFVLVEHSGLNDFHFELFIVRPETWAIQFVIRTGSREFSQKCVTNRSFGGFLPDDYQYIRGETRVERNGVPVALFEEIDYLNLLGIGWVEPRNRTATWWPESIKKRQKEARLENNAQRSNA